MTSSLRQYWSYSSEIGVVRQRSVTAFERRQFHRGMVIAEEMASFRKFCVTSKNFRSATLILSKSAALSHTAIFCNGTN